MKTIKEIFDVEIGEIFEIKDIGTRGAWKGCYFDENGELNISPLSTENRFIEMGALLNGTAYIIKHKKPILDEVEREYLKAVCEPYNVEYVAKREYSSKKLSINIYLKNRDFIKLPYFSLTSAIYKGMKVDKRYTPKQLGLED